MHIYTHIHTFREMHVHTHARVCVHTCTHTHTHTHIYIYIYVKIIKNGIFEKIYLHFFNEGRNIQILSHQYMKHICII